MSVFSSATLYTAITTAYADLLPYSQKYRVDKERYTFSLDLLTKLPKSDTLTVLDIGTGIGLLPVALRKLGVRADGVDYFIFPEGHNDMFGVKDLETLKTQWQKAGVTVYNKNIFASDAIKDLPRVDVIVNEAMIEHLKDPRQFLSTCSTLLNPGGYLLLTTPNIATLLKRIRFLLGRSPNWPIEEFFRDGEQFTGHWREYTMKELIYMCEKSGFTVLETHNKNFLTKYKNWRDWRKNLRALFTSVSNLIPGSREMHYVLCKKTHTNL